MKESMVDVIMHPVRMRIMQKLINDQLTAQQLMELLPDIPQASLYRNIKKLVEAGVIHIVEETPIRGTVEKVYSIQDPANATLDPEEVNNLSKDEQMSIFIKYLANLMGEFERYLSQGKIDFIADGVSFRQATLHLSDEEFRGFVEELKAVYAKAFEKKPAKGRRSRTFANILIPEPKNE